LKINTIDCTGAGIDSDHPGRGRKVTIDGSRDTEHSVSVRRPDREYQQAVLFSNISANPRNGALRRADLVTRIAKNSLLGPVGCIGGQIGSRQIVGRALAFGSVANVAVDYILTALTIDFADELDREMPSGSS
jgi:hypothetical protein